MCKTLACWLWYLFSVIVLVSIKVAQHSVQPTSGIRRVFWQFSEPRQNSAPKPCPRPAHLRLTQAVRRFLLKHSKGVGLHRVSNAV